MKQGFIKVAACTPKIRVADVEFNHKQILSCLEECSRLGVKLAVFPELCMTGYTCQDLFFQNVLIDAALEQVIRLAEETSGLDILYAVGLPVKANGKLYNCAAVIFHGKILGFIPKTHLPNYNEFYELRHFAPYDGCETFVPFKGKNQQGADLAQLLFECRNMDGLVVGFELCEDLWTADPVSNHLGALGATVICNLSASNEVIGKEAYRRQLVSNQSARLVSGYVYCSAGDGESTQDLVFSGHNIVAENGVILAQSKLFRNGITVSEIDVHRLCFERRKLTDHHAEYPDAASSCHLDKVERKSFEFVKLSPTQLTRYVAKNPFVPQNDSERSERCELILEMQSHGLMKRVEHTHSRTVVIGISGGLDSTLALLVCVKAMDLLGRDHTDIVAVTMPCFGTTKRTRSNAEVLCRELGVTFREIDITKSVMQHFEDLGHDPEDHSVVYENAQARERTKVLMNVANQVGGLVIGTGDLSELALGWATYNGDHMSMYGVNGSVPKTLVRHIVKYYADTTQTKAISDVLYDILDTPVSPELLPTDETGTAVTQKTEDLVGPYELHDFFLYYGVRWGFSPKKIYSLARYAFGEEYDKETILKWLRTFFRRFFSQQFKRSCLPDGAKIGSVTLSPRGDWRMPSDACADLWLEEITQLEEREL